MDFSLTDEQRMLVSSTRQLLPAIHRSTGCETRRERRGRLRPGVWELGSELGWAALTVPEEYGGLGRDLVDVALIAEEHGKTVQPGPLISNALVAEAISRSDCVELQAEVLPRWPPARRWPPGPLPSPGNHGPPRWCRAGDRKSRRIPAHRLKTAVQDAQTARWILVTARPEGRLAQFLVDRDSPGLTVRRQRTLDITRHFDAIRLDDVLVARIGRRHNGR